ncbi:polyprenyl synthetase family protein [Streptomyces lasiicapitis]|uniref:polyprenyl synthetase family protein n=1 Tax=Streptomyces lasiicapitis TaxID=1923961 RepID=UPI00331CD84F
MTTTTTLTPAAPPAAWSGVTRARELLPPLLRDGVARLGDELGRICGYQLGLCDADGRPVPGAGGKLIRPAFSVLCAEAVGGEAADALPAGAAIELLHNASLIHDDIMDGDRVRRHRPTTWVRFGVPRAILAGDALIALGFETLADRRHPATAASIADLARTLRRLAIGQGDDLRFEREREVGVEECLAMLGGKTGALLGCACRLGAAHGAAHGAEYAAKYGADYGAEYGAVPMAWLDRFEAFGDHLGVAFQLIDDVLGIWGDPAVTGKPVGSDLRARKKSAPVVAALKAGTAASARLDRLYATPGDLTDHQVAVLTGLVEEAGGRTWTLAEADRRIAAAWELLDPLDLDPVARQGLVDLTTALTARHA